MRSFDFSPLFRSTVGFDRLTTLLDSAGRLDEAVSYPPYNIEKTGADSYRVTMAVAGFAAEELSVVAEANSLTIRGKSQRDETQAQYLHRGIAARTFERKFDLADHIKVAGASLSNGLLLVDLAREVPEALKPRTIQIDGPTAPTVLQNKAA
ncbi:MAG: Hsp20 family protein [Proteobacteria bacterium]|nr:Hsp20 family protein [Pseudomonadota bacterium]